jgi:hypothetical protein
LAPAGHDIASRVGESVSLDGTESSDADGDALTYAWTEDAGNSATGLLSEHTAVMPTFTPTVAGTYSFTLVVNDGTLDNAPDAMVVTAAPAELPVIPTNEALYVYEISGGSTFRGAAVPVGGVIDAYDPDGVRCGTYTVGAQGEPAGFLAAMAVYKDDPATSPDEGANTGDEITFRINGYAAEVTRGGPVIWSANGSQYDISLNVPERTL